MNTIQNKAVRGLLALSVTAVVMVSCGEDPNGASSGSQSSGGGNPKFEIVSSWEPSLQTTGDRTSVDYSLIIANRGSSSGDVSCEIRMNGEILAGASSTVTIDPGEEDTVEGVARTQVKADNINLADLTPRCR